MLFNKPFGVLSQFTGEVGQDTLAKYILHKEFYAAGRLDKDSEGLLLLTDDGKLQHQISDPKYKAGKTYLVQLEGLVDDQAIQALGRGIELKDGMTRPADVQRIAEPELWPRDPPIRKRLHLPTSWIELTISEGRNRQVWRMTAAAGFPTLRLIRTRIADWRIGELQPGEWTLDTSE
jgi:23S rRNA pseudouridine2457 synthase